jgi:Glycine zipper
MMFRIRFLGTLSLITGAVFAGGCVTAPPQVVRDADVEPAPSTQVVFYPAAGQSAEQQDRDRYECYRWSVQQTGFDPAAPQTPPHERVAVVSGAPPAANTVSGAFAGALVGAAVSNPRNAGGGAILGALAGGLLGAAADQANADQAARVQAQINQRAAAPSQQRAADYRRAMSACLEGRGYTVK